jgi:hypothetical protein
MSFKKNLIILISIGFIFGIIGLYFRHLNSSPKTPKLSSSPSQPIAKSNDYYSFKSTGGNFTTYFPDNLIDQNSDIKVEKDNSSLTFSLLSSQNKKIVGQAQDNHITYSKISQSGSAFIDLRYTVTGNRIMEEFILNQKQTFPTFKQKINLFNTYVAKSSDSIQFNHPGTDKLLWYIPAPFMYEQNHPEIKHFGIKFNLECESPNTPLKDCRVFILTKQITPEGQAWLDDPARNYPVIIDPTVADSCWGVGGYCDDGCVYGAVTGSTVYTTCANGAVCAGTNCWYTSAGTCNASCTIASVTAVTAYTGCTATFCGTPGCWQYGSSCNSNCNWCNVGSAYFYPTYNDCINKTNGNIDVQGTSNCCSSDGSGNCYIFFTKRSRYGIYPNCTLQQVWDYYSTCTWYNGTTEYSYDVSNSGTWYTGSGTCAAGSGTCYVLTGGTTTYTGNGACGAANCAGAATRYQRTQCSWAPAQYPKVVSNATTRYTGSSACTPGGGGSCYKLVQDAANTYTGNGACGAADCAGAARRYTSQTCTWYGELGGDSLRFSGIRLERIRVN